MGAAEPSPEPPPDAVLATLPFEVGDANRVVIDLAPAGKRRFPMMLDTGAQGSVLTPRMARELGVTVRRMKSSPYRRETVLGRDLQFHVNTKLTDTGSKTGFEYGLLGGNFLEEYVVEIDFPGRQVRFLDPKQYRVPEDVTDPNETSFPLNLTARRPFAEVEIDGAPVQVLVDTGAPFPIVMAGPVAKKIGIDVDALAPFAELGFVVGSTEARFHEAASVRVGAIAQGPIPVLVVPRGSFNLGGATDSLVGYDLLAPFVVRFDYPRKRLWLRRVAPQGPTFLGVDYRVGRELGVFLVARGELTEVWRVNPAGIAQQFGLRSGDRVELDPPAVHAKVRAGDPLTVIRMRADEWTEVMLPEAQP